MAVFYPSAYNVQQWKEEPLLAETIRLGGLQIKAHRAKKLKLIWNILRKGGDIFLIIYKGLNYEPKPLKEFQVFSAARMVYSVMWPTLDHIVHWRSVIEENWTGLERKIFLKDAA